MVAHHPALRFAVFLGLLVLFLLVAGCSSAPSPTQPTPAASTRTLEHFGELVGTNWEGTASFGSGGGQTSRVKVLFLWGGVCDVQGWCANGYNAYGWGTVDDIRTKILGYNDEFILGMFRREVYLGEPPQGTGNWESAVLSSDRQHLVIRSSDFAWDQRRGVTVELSRVAWPAELHCPSFRTCDTY